MAKWALVAAGVKDLNRPADKLSVSQNVALAATGFIWVSTMQWRGGNATDRHADARKGSVGGSLGGGKACDVLLGSG